PIGVFAKYWIPYYSQKYNIDQAIWLDGDVIVEGDIEKLWNVDLADNYLAGVPDVISAVLHAKVGSKFAGHTLNAGVLLFNCNKLLEFNFLEKLAQETNALQDNALFVEQEALARVAYNHQLLLPYRYNVQTFQDVGYSVLSSDLFSGIMHNWLGAGGLDLKRYLQPSCSDGLIYHYCGCLRPWTASGVLNPYTDRWYRYLKLTQYYDFSAVIKSDLLCGASTGVKRVTQTYRWIRAVLRS
ncbi:MAG: hypothetical protein LBI20_03355, partial [Holosporales bacterium]|nr:hypothetical protein [Holosporales bacterium]